MLIERAAEISTLERSLASVSEGTGAAVVIEAPAGAGKSALLDVVDTRAREAGWLVRRAAHGPAERRFPLGTVRVLLEPFGADAVRDPFGTCSALAPVVLLVDDAQWADRASLDALAHLARRASDLPLLVVLAARPGDALAEIAGIAGVALLEPGPLSAAGAARLVRRVAPDAPVDRCRAIAGGDPWLLGELARGALDGPLSRGGRIELRRRLGQLAAPERRVAHALAILGDGAEPHIIAAVAQVAVEDVAGIHERLAWNGLDVHGVIARGVYHELPLAERERLHRAAASVLRRDGATATAVASHLLRCGPAADADATAALREAADGAAPQAAVAYLERALLERAGGDDRAALLAQLATAMIHAGLPYPRRRLLQALAERPAARTRVEILERLAALEILDPHDAALLDGEDDPELEQARLDALLMHPGRHEERALHVRARAGAPAHRAWLETETGRADAATCAALAREALTNVGGQTLHEGSDPSRWLAVRVLTLTDRVADAARAIARLRETAGDSVPLRALVAWSTAELALRAGRLGEAEAEARIAVGLGGAGLVTASAGGVLALALVERGALAEAREVLERAAGLRHACARLWLAEGDYEAAAAAAREVGRRCLAHGRRNPAWAPWRSTLALALAHLGRLGDAAAVADEEIVLARAFGAPTALARALHARTVSEPDAARRASLAATALTVFSGPAALVQAALQIEHGAALVRLGRRVEARDGLRRALATADAAGAAPLAERARRELVASGARPRRAAIEGAAALTPRQRQICELALAGKSNRAIAHALFLSVKTVETHLARAYGTLGVLDRAGMVAALAR